MSQATEHNTTPTARGSKALRSKIEKAPRKEAGHSRRPRPSDVGPIPEDVSTTKPNSKPKTVSPTYVYEIRVDGVVRYIGKGRNGRDIR